MNENLSKTYDPSRFEDRIYNMWESEGAFKASRDPEKKPFTIVMPPPNITGQLHMGHALDQTLQDVIIRFKRLQGYSALWLPGSDHASIATEVKVAERIKADEGVGKEEVGREEFLKRAWEWKEEFGDKITRQCRKLGDSCDWDRERFTMDEGCNRAVNHFFVKLYEKGLIYRGNRLINWCSHCGTSLSDAEVEHKETPGSYWYFRYPGADGGPGIVVATSRPETMFGDVAIAVHPDDGRYKDMIGKNVVLPLTGREIPVIADTYPDPEKGTGAVKITPAHDPNDFEVGKRHGLESPVCMDHNSVMNELAGDYEGMDRYECRRKWVKALDAEGFLVKTEEINIPLGMCYRCDTAIEPMLSDQWFVKMEDLAKPAVDAAKQGKLTHIPQRFEKIYLQWLEDIKDWCVSRQLWWGHRIPAYYCESCGKIMVQEHAPEECSECGSGEIKQDEDVLDTWFSSALWPFSTLGWPEETDDYRYFYPTDVLVTGYDIIFFWVVRMVFSAIESTGIPPFSHVYVHGLVRDGQGRKMSKSLGNGIDPLEIIDRYGADALRFMLVTGITPGNDMSFREERLESARNFANKLWNASRFLIMNLIDESGGFKKIADMNKITDGDLKVEDKWIISRINDAVKQISENMENFELALAGQAVHDLMRNEYCDWYIEIVKERLYGEDEKDKEVARAVLLHALKNMLRLLHPFMPFITEEIWSHLPAGKEGNPLRLINDKFPVYSDDKKYMLETSVLETAMAIVKAIRNIRAEADASPGKKLKAAIMSDPDKERSVKAAEKYIKHLAGIYQIDFIDDKQRIPEEVMTAVVEGAEIFIPLDELMDYQAEMQRLEKEKKKLEGEVKRVIGKLSNEGFMSKAPAGLISEEKKKKERYEEMLSKVSERLSVVAKKVK